MVRKLVSLAAISAAFANAVLAENVILYRPGEQPDPQEIAAILSGPSTDTPRLKFRSIRLLPQPEQSTQQEAPAEHSAGKAPSEPTVQATAEKPTALALPVKFSFDSANILPEAAGQLDAVAQGIKLLPPAASIVIEGHTDAHGPDRYNLELSWKRALAVKNYLVYKHSIDKSMLKTMGRGESAPFVKADPHAPENRRVQFRAG
jgi:outer membrane protein OmpA-like peptidoglycan-associated protein